jgi:hypothetical protein
MGDAQRVRRSGGMRQESWSFGQARTGHAPAEHHDRSMKASGTIVIDPRGNPGSGHEQQLEASKALEWGVINEIVPDDQLMARAREIAENIAQLPPLTSRYTRIALTQKLRRIVDEGIGYGLALEGISAADVARRMAND